MKAGNRNLLLKAARRATIVFVVEIFFQQKFHWTSGETNAKLDSDSLARRSPGVVAGSLSDEDLPASQ